jgi:hypothetical protein
MPNTTARIALVRAVGAGIRKTDIAVTEIVESLPDGFDHTARGAVAGVVHQWANGDATPPPVKTGPKGNQTTTDYGRGHDTITAAVKRALKGETPSKGESLTVTYVDPDGKAHKISVTRETDPTLYANLVSLAAAQAADSE